MNGLSYPSDSCTRFETLCVMAPEQLSPGERDFLVAHAAQCEQCGIESRLLSLFSREASPLAPLDDIARRSLIHAAIESLESPTMEAEVPSTLSNAPIHHRWKISALVALVAGLVLVIVGGVFGVAAYLNRSKSHDRTPSKILASVRVVMCSGRNDGALSRGVGASLSPGESLITGNGRSVLFLPARTFMLMDSGAQGAVARISGSSVEFSLEKGRILASVMRTNADPVFSILTPAGKVVVTGTLFSVEVKGSEVTVAVLHGRVRVEQPGKPPVYISSTESLILGRGPVHTMTAKQRSWAEDGMGVLQMMGNAESAQLAAHSEPQGSKVFVDGRFFGVTPLVTKLLPGYRNLSLQKSGFQQSEQYIQLAAGTKQYITVHLKPFTAALKDSVPPAPVASEGISIPPRANKRLNNRKLPAKNTVVNPAPVSPEASMQALPTTPLVPVVPAVPAVTAGTLMKKARELRAARKWREAAVAYGQLIKAFPSSAQANISRVSLGMIQLDHLGSPLPALRLFTRYLKNGGGGILAQEAAWGKIRALKALGYTIVERQALQNFLKRWPRAIQAQEAKHRLKILAAMEKNNQ
ncbi:FecR domain-containing protein [Myxococcota bacterium]|nr:FecR domain-containing protein [Myxococcota bacterium]MBU1534271.1 FecR domain-containing protein [Myxococcota bacterium]